MSLESRADESRVRVELRRLVTGVGHSPDDAQAAIEAILAGEANEVEITALLTAWATRELSGAHLAAIVRSVRARMTRLEIPSGLRPLLDVCGTGGDGLGTVNLSTVTAIVLAACGVRVAKHGNRAATGVSGSSDVLSVLGVRIDPPVEMHAKCLEEVCITYLHAPIFHGALAVLAPVRKQLPFRTVFNLIGPLVNPAAPEYQLVGVSAGSDFERVVEAGNVLAAEDRTHPSCFTVVRGEDGMDEVSLGGTTFFHQRRECGGSLAENPRGALAPDDFGLPHVQADALRVSGVEASARAIRSVLDGEHGPIRDAVLANVAYGLVVAGQIELLELRSGVERAAKAIDSKAAADLLDRWVRL
jgi:anthranilate phosphoribosyltransferase